MNRRDYRKTPRQQQGDETEQAAADAAAPDGGVGRPVQLMSDLAGFRQPEYLPGSPHRLPGKVRSNIAPLVMPGGLPGVTDPTVTPVDQTGILDPHHYASVQGVSVPVTQNTTQVPFLTAPSGKRNFLSLRNGAAAGNIFINFGQSADANSPIMVGPGVTILFDTVVPQDDLYAFASAAALTLSFGYSNIA